MWPYTLAYVYFNNNFPSKEKWICKKCLNVIWKCNLYKWFNNNINNLILQCLKSNVFNIKDILYLWRNIWYNIMIISLQNRQKQVESIMSNYFDSSVF